MAQPGRVPWSLIERSLDNYFALPEADRAAYLSLLSEQDQQLHGLLFDALNGQSADWIDANMDEHAAGLVRQVIDETITLPRGTVLGHYTLVELLGQGGMGEVYLGERTDGQVEKQVAIKLLAVELASSPAAKRFIRERQIVADMHHPGIVPLLDAGTTEDGRAWFAQELIRGKPLTQFCSDNRCTVEQRLSIMVDVCDAISHAHAKGVVHRDLHPANLLVEDHESGPRPFILDFGIALSNEPDNLTRVGQALGTPAYMSPEQARGRHEDVDHHSDIFSLGIVLYELCEGCTPFSGDNATDIAYQIMHADPAPLSDWRRFADLNAVVLQCLEKESLRRYNTVKALKLDLLAVINGEEVSARPQRQLQRLGRIIKSRPRTSTAVILMSSVMLMLAALAWQQYSSRQDFALRQVIVADRYSQAAAQIGNEIRLIYLRPQHDISDEVARLHLRFQALRDELPSTDEAGYYVASASLGRAALSLGLNEEARNLLDAAWTFDQSDVSLAVGLGEAHINLYSDNMDRLLGLADTDDREKEISLAARQHLDPALALLRRGSADQGNSAVTAQLLLAAYNGEPTENLDRAIENSAWPLPLMILRARIELTKAQSAIQQGKQELAMDPLQYARSLFLQATDMARSHPGALSGLCTTAALTISLSDDLTSLSPCETTVAVHPNGAPGLLAAGRSYVIAARAYQAKGRDPGVLLERAIELAESAIGLQPSNLKALLLQGSSLLSLAMWQFESGADPIENLHTAIKALQMAEQLAPADGSVQTELASALLELGRIEYATGRSGDASFDRSIEHLANAARLPQASPDLAARILEGLTDKAFYLFPRDQQAFPVLEQAMQQVAVLKNTSEISLRAQRAIATATWTYATWLFENGEDPAEYVKQSTEAFRRVIALDPFNFIARFNLVTVFGLSVDYALDRRSNQAGQVAEMQSYLRDLQVNAAPEFSIAIQLGYYHRLAAQQKLLEGADPSDDIALARSHLIAALGTVIDHYAATREFAYLVGFESSVRHATGNWDPGWFEHDKKLLQTANDEYADLYVVRAALGKLLVLSTRQARSTATGEQELERHGQTLLQQAFDAKPMLLRKFAIDTALQ